MTDPTVPAPVAAPATTAAPVGHSEPFAPAGVVWTPVSPRLTRVRRLLTAVWLGPLTLAPVVVGLVTRSPVAWGFVVALLLLDAWVWFLIPRQVRAMGYAERDDDLLIRRGVMFRSLVVVPYGRMQYVDVTAGPVARAAGIAEVQLHTASPATSASISGLPPEEAARLRDRLASRGEARLAGL